VLNDESQAFYTILQYYIQVSDLVMTCSKVLIIGLGQLGLAAAKYVKERGFDTYGYDINTEAMEIAHRSAGIKQVTDFGSHDFDVYIICVSTHKPDDIFSPQIDGILSIADKISREAKKDGALVSIESTIPKGTSKKVFEILNHSLRSWSELSSDISYVRLHLCFSRSFKTQLFKPSCFFRLHQLLIVHKQLKALSQMPSLIHWRNKYTVLSRI